MVFKTSCYTATVDDSSRLIDLGSDTVTLPSEEMRQAMANALLGDDVHGVDKTINSLYYESSDSTFCNTVHLCLWLLFLVVPLMIGLVTSGILSLWLSIGYTCFIGILFATLKAIVSHLHVTLDRSEPKTNSDLHDTSTALEPDNIEWGNDTTDTIELGGVRRSNTDETVDHLPRLSDDSDDDTHDEILEEQVRAVIVETLNEESDIQLPADENYVDTTSERKTSFAEWDGSESSRIPEGRENG